MDNVARCQCVFGDPQIIGSCHCEDCQRRTGSVFGVGAYYRREQVKLEGAKTIFRQKSNSERDKHFSFCPSCGTTVYWELDGHPDLCGIAVGAFADPAFRGPSQSWREQSAHDWIRLPDEIQHHRTQ